ncbi:MAG TPA: HAMP domain-containing sensor histidine kinase [Dehalococcoidia bacterium]|nr:HAMP domain-containing sensor histidine kinase [Dehalococcoidia bacterium]
MEDNKVVLSVTDTGAGIPDASKAKIFDPFFATEGNYGMGLSIAYGIITRHGGSIDVESGIG